MRHKTSHISLLCKASSCKLARMGVGLCLLFVTLTPVAEAQPGLGRLFTTPALRAELDRRRLRELQGNTEVVAPIYIEPIENEIAVSDAPVPDMIYAVGGSMRRSDGSFTIWINEVAIEAADLPANMQLLQPYSQGQIRIQDPETGASYIVKPGQVLNLTQGELMESYEYRSRAAAAVNRNRAAESAAANNLPDVGAPAASDAVRASPVTSPSAVELFEQVERIQAVPR